MRYTYSNNFGCLILVLIMFFMFSFISVISRLIFTTPLGIVLLISVGVWYVMKSMQINGKSETTYTEQEQQTYNWQADTTSDSASVHEDAELTRDAEDVDFKEIDDE